MDPWSPQPAPPRGDAILDLAPPPADARIPYGPGPWQFGDLRLPAGPGPHPLAIGLHGGFWRARYDLQHLGHLCAALATAGIATWSLEYRRVGNAGGGYPGTLDDVAQGAAFASQLAARCPLDLGRVVVFGHSAGGQLALWLGSRAPFDLRAVIGLAALSDLAQASALRLGDGIVDEFLGGGPAEVPVHYAAASPRARLPLGQRQILLHGQRDDTVPFAMSVDYVAAAIAAGDAASLIAVPEAGHFELIDPRLPEGRRVVQCLHDVLCAPTP